MDLKSLSSEFEDYIRHIDSIVEKGNIHKDNIKEVVISGLFVKIFCGAYAIGILLKNNCGVEAEIILRSTMEALFQMGACLKDDKALHNYLGRDLYNKMHYSNIVLQESEIYEKDEKKLAQDAKGYAENQIHMNNFEKPFTVEKVAGIATVPQIYKSYRIHSEADHSSPSYLLKTYMEYNDDGIYGINIGMKPDKMREMKIELLSHIIPVLSLAASWFRSTFNIPCDTKIRELDSKYISL